VGNKRRSSHIVWLTRDTNILLRAIIGHPAVCCDRSAKTTHDTRRTQSDASDFPRTGRVRVQTNNEFPPGGHMRCVRVRIHGQPPPPPPVPSPSPSHRCSPSPWPRHPASCCSSAACAAYARGAQPLQPTRATLVQPRATCATALRRTAHRCAPRSPLARPPLPLPLPLQALGPSVPRSLALPSSS
jgi:hypothetical protein